MNDQVLEEFLFQLNDLDKWTAGDACRGTGIFGATGSGKTSGVAQNIGGAMLNLGAGGIVLCAKNDEAKLWKSWAESEDREKSIIHLHEGVDCCFEPLFYEMTREGGGHTENILNIFNTIIQITQKADLSQGENAYFYQACNQLLRNAISLCKMAYGRVSIIEIYDLIASAPTHPEQLLSDDWKEKSNCFQAIKTCNEHERAKQEEKQRLGKPYLTNHDLDICAQYFLRTYPELGDRLRSAISSIFTASADPWMRDPLRKIFCRRPDEINPETGKKPFYIDFDYCKEGAIYLLDFPVKNGMTGRLIQSLLKFMWQQHMERRDVTEDGGLPVFLWADEAQNFVLPEQDALFAQTARSSRIMTVLLTQNISNYYVAFGQGEHGKNQTDSLLGNLSTLMFCANSHEATNRWASGIFGTTYQNIASTTTGGSTNASMSEQGGSSSDGYSSSTSISEQQRNVVEPRDFTLLKTGGEANDYLVQAYVNQSGRVWKSTGSNAIKVGFCQ